MSPNACFPVLLVVIAATLGTAVLGAMPQDGTNIQQLASTLASNAAACPCDNKALCSPVQVNHTKEVVAFQVNASNWRHMDFGRVTTIVVFNGVLDNNMLCAAHDKNIRVVWKADYDTSQLGNETARSQWVQQLVDKVKSTYTDGVNLDFENPIEEFSDEYYGLSSLVIELRDAMKAAIPTSQISFDVAWNPTGVDGRFFDYGLLSVVLDFVVIMDYDTRSQIFPPNACVAGPNADMTTTTTGIEDYLKLYPDPSKLVLGVPWYGYSYPCIGDGLPPDAENCPIKAVPFRGAPCSDAAGGQIGFVQLYELARSPAAATTIHVEAEKGYAWFNYYNTKKQLQQVFFDTPETLRAKYSVAKESGLRGLSMWEADMTDYTTDGNAKLSDAMWKAMDVFLK